MINLVGSFLLKRTDKPTLVDTEQELKYTFFLGKILRIYKNFHLLHGGTTLKLRKKETPSPALLMASCI